MNLAATHLAYDRHRHGEDEEDEEQQILRRVRSRKSNAAKHAHLAPDTCPMRRKVRNMCENLRDQYLSARAKPWVRPKRYNNKRHPDKPDVVHKYRRNERRLYGEFVYVCTETHTSTPDHQFDPLVEDTNVHHRKPKWMVDRSCRSTWVAVTMHIVVMVIIVASVLTYIIDSLNYEYCMNACPDFDRAANGSVENCTLPAGQLAVAGGCNPADNTGVPCDKEYADDALGAVLANKTNVNFYCTYHVAKGIMDESTIFACDVFFTAVFMLELLVRLVVAESWCHKRKELEHPATPFFADGLNWCDFLAILPLPAQLMMLEIGIDNSLRTEALENDSSAGVLSSLAIVLELFKLLRVVRVFKIARHFSGTRVMVKTMQKSMRPIGLTFIVLFLVFTVLGSALMLFEPCYGAPGTDECQFPDLFTAGYFLMITILTVGYGDQTPKTDVGRLIGILCMILGSCFLAMPLAIVGNKFQAAYEQEQMENSRHSTDHDEHMTKAQRRQRMLNEGFIMLGTLDHLERVADKSAEQCESAIGNLYKTHRVLAKDMAVLFPKLKPAVDAMLRRSEEGVGDDFEDEEDAALAGGGGAGGCCAGCVSQLRRRGGSNNARVAPVTATAANEGGESPSSPSAASATALDEETRREMEEEDEREAAAASGKCRDRLWLCMEVHSSGKCAMAAYIVRHTVVILALLLSMFMMFHELNRWDETSQPCQRVAASWCDTIRSLPDDWRYTGATMLDVSGRFENFTKAQLLAANPICGNMTCGAGLACNNASSAEAADVLYAGCVSEDDCFVNGTALHEPVRCPVSSVRDTASRTYTVYSPTFAVVTESWTVTEYDTRRDFFDTTALSMSVLWDQTPVCERLVCKDNSEFAAVASMDQGQLNFLFGLSEAFFCAWFVGEFALRVVAARSWCKFARSFSNWLELACAAVAVYELTLLSVQHGSLYYEVWGMPVMAAFPPDHVRPLRVIVPLRFLLMSRSYSGADVLLETARKAAPKLAIPVFFLMIMLVIFAGVYFALETQMDCHVEKVQVNEFDGDAEVFQYVRDVAGDKCDLQDILDGMWLTIVTVTSVGYGRFYPRNITGQLLSIFVAIVGAFYMAMPLAIVGTTFYNAYKLKEEARARVHVHRRFRVAVGLVTNFIRKGQDGSSETQYGLSKEEVDALEQYVGLLGPTDQFSSDPKTLRALRDTHLVTMKILGHMLATIDVADDTTMGMFR